MSIDFNAQRWARIKTDYAKWWAGKLKRPLIQILMSGRDPGRPEPNVQWRRRVPNYADDVTPEQIADRWEYDMSRCYFLGDAFPKAQLDFGPLIMTAMLGCELEVHEETIWFAPPKGLKALGDIDLKYDPENKWVKRVIAMAEAAGQRFGGGVQLCMPTMGDGLDVLSAFRPGERLLFDMVDEPEVVEKLVWQTFDMLRLHFDQIDKVFRKYSPGWSCWATMFSAEPYYMLQSDFCYMIGPEMFERFVKPELVACCKWIKNNFYHLDGVGQLPHLDSILAIPELKGVQWIPGTGKPEAGYWPEVIAKVRKAGKLVQVYGSMAAFDSLVEKIGSAEGMCLISHDAFPQSREKELEKFLLKYGAL